nr:hypothetical protein [Candidatus Njordarchaeota archaeon]
MNIRGLDRKMGETRKALNRALMKTGKSLGFVGHTLRFVEKESRDCGQWCCKESKKCPMTMFTIEIEFYDKDMNPYTFVCEEEIPLCKIGYEPKLLAKSVGLVTKRYFTLTAETKSRLAEVYGW